jgi:hypothetical protein
MSLTDTMTASRRTTLPLSWLAMPRVATSTAGAELIALGRQIAPLFERWHRQIAAAGSNMTVAARERLYQKNDRLQREAGELIDQILACTATTIGGIAVQVRAALLDADLDALVLDPDTRRRGFLASLCAFTGVAFPITD